MSLFGTGRRETVLAAMLLVVLGVVLHLPGLAFGQHRSVIHRSALAPTASRDALRAEGAWNEVVLYPALRQAGATWRAGDVPLWNPLSRLGEPFSFSGAPIWYPPYWLVIADLGPWSIDLLLALHTIVAAIAMFRFLRVMPMSRYVSFLGGASYGLGWFMTASLDRLPEAAAAAILPFALECTWRCLSWRRGSRPFVPGLALAVGAMFAAGGVTTAWLGLGLCACVLLVGLSAVEREHRALAIRLYGFATLSAALLLAPLWLAWLQHSASMQPELIASTVPGLRPAGLFGMFGPGLFGDLRGIAPPPIVEINPAADPLERVLYPGAFVLFAGMLGLLRPKRSYQGLFWVLVAGTGLLLAVENPLHELLGWTPARAGASLVLFHLGAVVIASISLETFLDNPMARPYATSITCGAAIGFGVLLAVFGFLAPSWGDAAVAVLTPDSAPSAVAMIREFAASQLIAPAVCLALLAGSFMIWRRVGILRFKPTLAFVVILDLSLQAILSVPRATESELESRTVMVLPDSDGRAIRVDRDAPHEPNSWLAAGGKRALDTPGPAILERTATLLSAVDPGCLHVRAHHTVIAPLLTSRFLDDPILARAGVDVATSAQSAASSKAFVPLTARPGGGGTGMRTVLGRRRSAPRAWLAYEETFVNSSIDACFVRRRVSEDAVVLEAESRDLRTKRPTEPASITWLEDSARRIAMRVEMREGRGYLVVGDAFAEGWMATVDGVTTEILPADIALRAVPLREGTHEVVFSYAPWSWRFGLPLFVLGALLALAYGGAALRWRPRA